METVMNDVNMELILLIIIVALVVFAVLGIYIGTRISSDKKRIRELETELSDTKKELEGYRSKVNNHFKRTSELFTQMTSTYKAVYLHLAEGSHELCTTDTALLNPSNGEFLKVTHEVEQQAAKEAPVQADEEPMPKMEPPDHPHPSAETPEQPEPVATGPIDTVAETTEQPKPVATGPIDTAPEAEAEKPAQQVPETPEQALTETQEQHEVPTMEPAAREEVADTAEPDTTPEDSKDMEADRLRVVGS
jgi:uncharacterized membrane-anchored protein YhcB (DUF1043 family)